MRLVRSFGYDNAVAFALINLLGYFPAILGCVAWPLLRGARHQVRQCGCKLPASSQIRLIGCKGWS